MKIALVLLAGVAIFAVAWFFPGGDMENQDEDPPKWI